MHRATWILQIVLGSYFVAIGVLHFVVPSGLPGPLVWMYDAAGLATVMLLAAAWHLSQGGPQAIVSNLVLAVPLTTIAVVR